MAKELSLQIVQHVPTHHRTPTSHKWIDLILVDDNDELLDHENKCLPNFGKDAIIDATISYYVPAPVKDSFSYRDYKNICSTTLNTLFPRCDWVSTSSIESDLERALDNLKTVKSSKK